MFRNEFGMLRLVYSMVLSRGVNQIQKDLNDDAESPLIGSSRGLCSFELMSLLLRGLQTVTLEPLIKSRELARLES